MSTKRFCDGCEDELDSDNTFGRSGAFTHTFQATNVQFEFSLSFSSNAGFSRLTSNNGDICTSCVQSAMLEYLKDAGVAPSDEAEPDVNESDTEIEDAFAEDENENENEDEDD